jgi:hypothetical protein
MSTTETIDEKIENILERSAKVEDKDFSTFYFNTKDYTLGFGLEKGVSDKFFASIFIHPYTNKVTFYVLRKGPNNTLNNYNQFTKSKTDTKFWSNISLDPPPSKGGKKSKKSKKTKKSTKKQRKTRKHKK